MVKKFIQIVPFYPLTLNQTFKEDYWTWPAAMMKEKGFEPEFVTLRSRSLKPIEMFVNLHRGGLKPFEVINGYVTKRFPSIFHLWWYLLRQDALIHTHLRPYPPSLFAALLPKKKVMTPFSYELGSTWLIKQLSLFLMKRFDRIIPISPYEAEVYAQHHFKKGKVVFIPLAIDYGLYSNPKKDDKLAQKYGLRKGDFTVITVATYRYFKRVDVILAAFKELKKKVKNCRMIVVGEDWLAKENKPSIKEIIASLGLKEGRDVVLTGVQPPDAIRRFFYYADVFVNSSSVESQCLAAYEAGAAGLPLCLPRHRSFSDVFTDNVLYHTYDDPHELAENLFRYYSDKKLVGRNVSYVKNLMKGWDYGIVKAKLGGVYEEILSK